MSIVMSVDKLGVGTMLDKIIQTQKLARTLLDEYDLEDWSFEWSSQKVRVGECNYTKKTIRYSTHYLAKTPDSEIEDTIRHEIAHALAFVRYGRSQHHNHIWKMIAREVGASPTRCTSIAETTANYNFMLECPTCGRTWFRYRRRNVSGLRCGSCDVILEVYDLRKEAN